MTAAALPDAINNVTAKARLQHIAQHGLLQHAIADTFDGNGNSFAELVVAHEQCGRKSLDCGLILSINAHLWGSIFPILNHGSDAQKRWLPQLISAELIGGHAITEPQAGSDLNALTMRAERDGDSFILNGHKRYITNTPIADMLVVYARLDGQLSAFIVKKTDPGTQFQSCPEVQGCATAPMGDVILENCMIPVSRLLGKPGAGNLLIQQALELERAFIFAGILGIMQWQLESVIRYSKTRQSNGVHLGKHQAISHKIADMKLRLDTIRLWLNECARLKDHNKRITLASAQTKLFASEAFLESSLDAVQILGASGLEQNNQLSQLVLDAQASRLFSGSSEIQKNIIAALLGTGDGYKLSM
jgi:L-prolyl-PCP dehydrogenase